MKSERITVISFLMFSLVFTCFATVTIQGFRNPATEILIPQEGIEPSVMRPPALPRYGSSYIPEHPYTHHKTTRGNVNLQGFLTSATEIFIYFF